MKYFQNVHDHKVLLLDKSYNTEELARMIRSVLSSSATCLTLLNGMGNAEILQVCVCGMCHTEGLGKGESHPGKHLARRHAAASWGSDSFRNWVYYHRIANTRRTCISRMVGPNTPVYPPPCRIGRGQCTHLLVYSVVS